jgi:hypothetical protein
VSGSKFVKIAFVESPYMSQAHQTETKTIELSKIARTEEDIGLIQQHVKEVVEGAAFRGSQRSGQFLRYIVDQAIARHFDALKERVIGVELFGRDPSYDTGDDAIVRVTASDVRKRLLQHYGRFGAASEFRISLPPGSYVPEITRDLTHDIPPIHTDAPHDVVESKAHAENHEQTASGSPIEIHVGGRSHRWIAICLAATVVNLALWGFFLYRFSHRSSSASAILPWSVLLDSRHALQIITSDPDIAEIQGYTGQPISVSDYANHTYIPEPDKLTPEVNHLSHILLRGNKAAQVDAPIAVSIAELAHSSVRKIEVHPARGIQLANLQTDDNFVILGSPRSNPWSAFFSDQLNFRFVYDKNSGQEIIRNIHPRSIEQPQYVPTGLGWATGQSYAIVALVRNPDQNGHVLLVAGANAEGTEAAGKLVTDLPRLSTALRNCGISPSAPQPYFELLLRLNMMAGSPTSLNVEACRNLTGSSVQ